MPENSKQKEFDERIAEIYAVVEMRRRNRPLRVDEMDLRHQEFQAMADAFLGENYDRQKLRAVEDFQIELRESQGELLENYQLGGMSAEVYVKLFNDRLGSAFEACERILGQADFVKLFGAKRAELGGFIDKEAFLAAERRDSDKKIITGGSIRGLVTIELQDIYSAENQILQALPQMEEAARTQSLKRVFQKHRQQTEQQVQRLEEVCRLLGIKPEGETCEAMEGLIEEGELLIDELDQGPVLDAALIGAAQKVEHYEIAAYGTLTAMLKAMGEQKAADLMAQTLQEAKQTDELLTQVAEREVNPAATGQQAANNFSSRGHGAT